MEVFKYGALGGSVPHPSNTLRSKLPRRFHHTARMAYYNPANSSFYSTPTASNEFRVSSFRSQNSAVEELAGHRQSYHIFNDHLSAIPQPSPVTVANLLTGFLNTDNYGEHRFNLSIGWCLTPEPLGTAPSAIPFFTGTPVQDDGQAPQPDNSWPAVGQQVEYHNTIFQNWDTSSVSTQEAAAAIPGPSNSKHPSSMDLKGPNAHRQRTAPLGCWRDNQSGPSTNTLTLVSDKAESSFRNSVDTFSQSNVVSSHQHSSGRFQPYGTPRGGANRRRSAEVGPSTLVPSFPPDVESPWSQSPGWTPETTADAETNRSTKEEEEALVSSFYRSRILRVAE